MPEITHTNKPAIPGPSPDAAAKPVSTAQTLASLAADPNTTQEQLEKLIESVLKKKKAENVAAAAPKEPDWATMTEREALKADTYIPTIDHQVPEYLNVRLKDPEYMVVWASTDQRRIGQLSAEGYEFLKEEDIHPDFHTPLKFDSEHRYQYMDLVCMKVHKRILFAKRRKVINITHDQIKMHKRLPSSKHQNPDHIGQGMDLYEAESSIA